jgi:hypothetical protein
MDHEQIKQMIDACRPGIDDLRKPEMAALADRLACDAEAAAAYDRSQRFDSAVAAAFRDAPVPSGLEERLLAAVGAPSRDPATAPAAPVKQETSDWRFSRRTMLAAVAALAASVVAAVGYPWLLGTPREVTSAELVVHTQDMLDDVDFANAAAWKPVTENELHAFPFSFLARDPDAWRRVNIKLDRQAIAYRVPVGNKSAYLLVMRPSATPVGLGGAPGSTPLPGATGGWRMTAWTSGDALYVLAFEGDFRGLLRSRPTA